MAAEYTTGEQNATTYHIANVDIRTMLNQHLHSIETVALHGTVQR